jgi:hypothetical protein
MRKLIENLFKKFDDRPIIYIRYCYLKHANNKKVCSYVGESERFSLMRQFRKELSPGVTDNYDEIRILYAPKDKKIRQFWEAYLVVKLLPMYQIEESKLKPYISILNKRKMKDRGLIVEGSSEYVELRRKYKESIYHGGRIPLGYKITTVPNTKHINLRTQEIKDIKITEYDINSKEYEMIMDIIMLYGKKNFKGYKNMSIRSLSDYIEKKYNKKLADSHIHGIRKRELEKNAKHWNSFYA